ncbi:CPBP family intramembrane glutamic endopeptidase [Aquimarina sp. 2201CG5-10]|uniref:CPBP family intramembrane glutamic endopeptidase n=1 Tax=Aquimarina callyspongiae TaxID=3098150 RepID=UPI002AB58C1D|nr:CPBP family glutamic-type intramembrane protease [Aquimarina sp. 2201CG5-10]MDY8136863.1 CPBP family glutamic-type intramembrane protease [Aquimarina sp. 2201CG5-10]
MNMVCKSCGISLSEEANFCPDCGTPVKKIAQKDENNHTNLIIAFYITELVFLIITYFIYKEGNSLFKEIVIESISAIIILGFASLDFKNILKLYNFPRINPWIYFGVVITPLITGLIVYYGMEFVNLEFFYESYNIYAEYAEYPNSLFWAILFIAITPPIFEELAFRGFLFNQLQKVANPQVTIILTAFIFSLVHFSFISLIWIFPFGLLLGYLRYKYNTLWLGIIIHFIHNLIVLSLDYYYFGNTLSF